MASASTESEQYLSSVPRVGRQVMLCVPAPLITLTTLRAPSKNEVVGQTPLLQSRRLAYSSIIEEVVVSQSPVSASVPFTHNPCEPVWLILEAPRGHEDAGLIGYPIGKDEVLRSPLVASTDRKLSTLRSRTTTEALQERGLQEPVSSVQSSGPRRKYNGDMG